LASCASFDKLKFDIFDVGGPQCHCITSVRRAGRFPYVHWHPGPRCSL